MKKVLRSMPAALALAAMLVQSLGAVAPAGAQARPRVISGTITSVSGHLVTIQRSAGSIVINDQPALDQQSTGNVAVGRQVVAAGYWQGGTFYATSFADANVYGGASVPGTAGGARLRGVVRGTITGVQGHLVTVQNGGNSIVLNDQPALDRKLSGNVKTGNDVVASGYWQHGTFYATTISAADSSDTGAAPDNARNFGAFRRIRDSLSGTITGVSGNQVTLQQATRSIVVNDQPALNGKMSGNVAVGRQVIANGYWLHGTFFVNAFTDATP